VSLTPYKITEKKIKDFWLAYNQQRHENKVANIREKVNNKCPVIARFRFRFAKGEDIWDEGQPLGCLTACYQEAMRNILVIDDEKAYTCLALESNEWKDKNGKTCVDIALHFPFCRVDTKIQTGPLRESFLSIARQRKLNFFFHELPEDDWSKCLSNNLNSVSMYGSIEEKGQEPLELKKCFSLLPIGEDGEDFENYDDYVKELEEIDFDSSLHEHYIKGYIKAPTFSTANNDSVDFWLPYYLSIGYGQTEYMPKEEEREEKYMQDEEEENPLSTMAKELVDIIRGTGINLNEWEDIGRCLYKTFRGSSEGYKIWEEVSKDFSKECGRYYYGLFKMEKINLTIKTLAFLVREKDKEKYRKWHEEWCREGLKKCLNLTHNDIAEALYRHCWLDFVCARDKNKWYMFKDHRWVKIKDGLELKKIISGSFANEIEKLRHRTSQKILDSYDPKDKDRAEGSIKLLGKLITSLKTHGFKEAVMKEAIAFFSTYDKFEQLLDSNVNLLGIENGVLEVIKDKVIFRSGRPEDFICKSAGTEYIDFDDPANKNDKRMAELLDWIDKLFPSDDMKNYFLKYAASILKGGNDDKIFAIFTGEGNNSKSMIVKLFECTLGSYSIKFPITLLTGKRTGSSNATPELARARATRIAFLDEPGGDETIGNGQLKSNTGGDSFYARNLHEEGGEVKATYKLVMQCNNIPVIPHADKATNNRTRIFPFISTWAVNAPQDEKEQRAQRKYKLIPNFDQSIPFMTSAFLFLMVKYFPMYRNNGLISPNEVTKATEEYWDNNDTYKLFIRDCITEIKNAEGKRDEKAEVSLSDIYSEFKIWFKDNYPGSRPPDRTVVKNELEGRMGKSLGGKKWFGIGLKGGQVVNLANI
jgi:phage/plasmid-associated DNA primase